MGSDSFLTLQLFFNRDAKQFEDGPGNKSPLCFYILAEKLFGNWNKNIIVYTCIPHTLSTNLPFEKNDAGKTGYL